MQRTRNPVVPPQFVALRQPQPVLTDRNALSGAPVFAYWGSAKPLRKEFGAVLPLPCTKRQLSGGRMGARTGFRHRVDLFQ